MRGIDSIRSPHHDEEVPEAPAFVEQEQFENPVEPEIELIEAMAPEPIVNDTDSGSKLKSRPFLTGLTFCTIILFISFMVATSQFVYEQARIGTSYYQTKLAEDEKQLRAAVDEKNIAKISEQLRIASKDILEAKLFAERYGQDTRLFNYSPYPKSSISRSEVFLDLAYLGTSEVGNFRAKLANLFKVDFIGDGSLVDLGLVQSKVDQLVAETERNVQNIQTEIEKSYLPNRKQIINKIEEYRNPILGQVKFFDDNISWLSGADGKQKNIMVIFQNNRELRGGTGGSLGSFGIARFKDGKMAKVDFGTNIYKLDNEFKSKTHIPVPSELEAFGPDWSLKQSGFAVDGPEAFQKIEWFYEQEAGEHLDGVLTVDTTAFISLLRLIGPIDLPAYGKTIHADNFIEETEQEVRYDYFDREGGKEENEPKKILGDMMPIVTSRLIGLIKNEESRGLVMKCIESSLIKKNILLYLERPELQHILLSNNWSGQVLPTKGDYLNINNSNLAGGKTNQSIVENVNLKVNIASDGTAVNLLNISRFHTGKRGMDNGLDRNYIRVLIPDGSKVENFTPVAGNFQRYYDRGYKDGKKERWWPDQEAGKSTINFWMSTMPQETTEARMQYTPNYKIEMGDTFEYDLLLQNQPGAPADNINLEINYPSGYMPINEVQNDTLNHKITIPLKLESDLRIQIKFKKGSE